MSFSNAQRNMVARTEGFIKKEQTYKNLKERANQRIQNARGKIRQMHEIRAEKQDLLDRSEYKIKQVENRLKTVEHRIEATRQCMRVPNNASEEITRMSQRLKDTFQKKAELQAKMIRGMRRKDSMEKQIQAHQEKEAKYREKMKFLLERMKYQISRRDECKRSIKEKVDNIKEIHALMLELEPKLREMYTRMRRAEVSVYELEEKIQRKENEIRTTHKESIYAHEDKERAFVEFEVKKERKFKGHDAMKQLAR